MDLSVDTQNGDTTRISASGRIRQPPQFPEEDPLVDLLGDDVYGRRVLFDLQAVESIDSSGVGWLLTCHRRFRTAGGGIVLHSLSPFVRDVLRVLNMQLVFSIAADESAAANSVLDNAK